MTNYYLMGNTYGYKDEIQNKLKGIFCEHPSAFINGSNKSWKVSMEAMIQNDELMQQFDIDSGVKIVTEDKRSKLAKKYAKFL